MTIAVKRIVSSFLALALTACATAIPHVAVGGRPVEIQPTSGGKDSAVKGELLAVGPERLWILGPGGVRDVPCADVEEARVRLHGLSGRKAWAWVALGALATGVALTAACAAADAHGCNQVFGITVGTWALLGVPSAASLSRSSRLFVHGPDFSALRPYARFPQGMPEGLDPGSLRPGPPERHVEDPLSYDRPKE